MGKLDFVDQVKAALDCSSIHNKENQLKAGFLFKTILFYKLYFKEKTTYLG
jgi:hypothetical protein